MHYYEETSAMSWKTNIFHLRSFSFVTHHGFGNKYSCIDKHTFLKLTECDELVLLKTLCTKGLC